MHLKAFAVERAYQIEFDQKIVSVNSFSLSECKEFLLSLKICAGGKPLLARDYQVVGITKAIRFKRLVLLSPTSSGKSYMIYGIVRYLLDHPELEVKRILIVVPNVQLVEQIFKDFAEYSFENEWRVGSECQLIYAGKAKVIRKHLTISTWQSIYECGQDFTYSQGEDFFSQFDAVIGDEAHTFQAKSLSLIMKRLVNAKFRIGTTGTLDGLKVHRLTIEGHFGPVVKITTSKKLMDAGYIAQLSIKLLVLRHSQAAAARVFLKLSEDDIRNNYQKEIDWLVDCTPRNKFIKNLVKSLSGNTLVLYRLVSKHGAVLNDLIKPALKGRQGVLHPWRSRCRRP